MADEDAGPERPGFGAFAASVFFLLLPAATAGGAMALAPLQAAGGALAAPWRSLLPISWLNRLFLAMFVVFVAYLASTTLWSVYPQHGQALRLAGGVSCGLLFAAGSGAGEQGRRLLRAVGVAAVLMLTGLLLIEAFANMPLNRLAQPHTPTGLLERNPGRGASTLACLVWASVGALAGGSGVQRLIWRALLIGVGIVGFQFDQSANAIGFLLGAIAYGAGYAAPRTTILALCMALAVWLLAAPWVSLHVPIPDAVMAKLPDSWAVRTQIWHFAATQIDQHPLLGLGLDASRTFPQTGHLRGLTFDLLPLHPHSASMQIWLETGAVGAVLGAATMLLGGLALGSALRNDRVAAASACGVIACAGLIANVSYGAWQEWWIATLFAAAALVNAARRHDPEEE